MKNLFLSVAGLLALSIGSTAQTINIEDMTPQMGDIYTAALSFMAVSPGTSGLNQMWDLSGLNDYWIATSTSTIVSPEGLPGAENFPNATHANPTDGQESIAYISYGNNKIEMVGVYNPYAIKIYPNPKSNIEFPLSFQTSWSDTYEMNATADDGTFTQEIGTTTSIVDGSGTLITPTGTYTDVLRMKQAIEKQVITSVDGQVVSSYTNALVDYMFLKAGYAVPLAIVADVNSSGIGSWASYSISSIVGLDKLSPVNELTIFPVPVINNFTINMDLEASTEVTFNLFSLDGRMIAQLGKDLLPSGYNTRALRLPKNTASGVYLLQIQTPESALTKKIVVH